MCSLCGLLADRGHWTETAASPEVFASRIVARTTARERQVRSRVLNVVLAHYHLSVSDWGGNAYILRSATGRSRIVTHLGELWPAAASLLPGRCDALDPALVAHLEDVAALGRHAP